MYLALASPSAAHTPGSGGMWGPEGPETPASSGEQNGKIRYQQPRKILAVCQPLSFDSCDSEMEMPPPPHFCLLPLT